MCALRLDVLSLKMFYIFFLDKFALSVGQTRVLGRVFQQIILPSKTCGGKEKNDLKGHL